MSVVVEYTPDAIKAGYVSNTDDQAYFELRRHHDHIGVYVPVLLGTYQEAHGHLDGHDVFATWPSSRDDAHACANGVLSNDPDMVRCRSCNWKGEDIPERPSVWRRRSSNPT